MAAGSFTQYRGKNNKNSLIWKYDGRGVHLQTKVKKWLREKGFGFLDNGSGPDIMVRKANLVNCQYLKVGSTVEFECHTDNRGLIAKNVRLARQRNVRQQPDGNQSTRNHPFGVMT